MDIVETLKNNKVVVLVAGAGALLFLILRSGSNPQTVTRNILLSSGDTFAGTPSNTGTNNRSIRPPWPGPGPQPGPGPGPDPEPMPLPNPEPSPIPIGRRLPPGGNTGESSTSFGVVSPGLQKFRVAQVAAKNYLI